MYSTLLTELSEGILLITVNRPEKLNALNKTVIEELAEVIESIYKDGGIKGAIITGSGPKSFVAGADISEFLELNGEGGQALARKGQEKVFSKIENCPKPIIGAVNGFALGGGCELAMACHFRTGSETARFGQPEINLGLIPGYGGTQRLTQLIGKGKAMELMLTGAMMDAATANAFGLLNHIFPAAELISQTTSILKTIINKAPLAITEIIALTNLASSGDPQGLDKEIIAFGKLFDTADAKEGASAFLEKRAPNFKGQ